MPPPGYEPFLRAICADPGDDTARLVYADWLDENGDPDRAEFIRLQIGHPRRPKEFDPQYERMEALRERHGHGWRNEFPGVPLGPGTFRRGFVDEIVFRSFRSYEEYCAPLLALTPACDVRLLQVNAQDVAPLLRDPNAHRLTVLKVNAGGAGEEAIAQLVNAAWTWRLCELHVAGWELAGTSQLVSQPVITDRAATLLLRSNNLPRLRSLRLSGVSLSSGVYGALVERFGKGLWVAPRVTI